MEFSRIDRFEARLWSGFLKVVSGFERKFLILGVVRFVSLPITFFACLTAGLLSAIGGGFDLKLFLVLTLGLLLAHASSNVINDWWDWKFKVDTPEYFRKKYTVHPVDVLGERWAFLLGLALSFLAFLCGLYLFSQRGVGVLLLAFLGFILLFSYSGPPFKFKYVGLGELIVFLVWGPLQIAGGFWVITGKLEPFSFFLSLPYGITASLILFGKHLDKIDEDRAKGVRTLPVILGEERTKKVVAVLIFIPYVLVLVAVLLWKIWGLLFSFVSLPRALKVARGIFEEKPRSVEETPDFYPREFWPMWYVGGAFIFNTDFALSYIGGLFLHLILF